MYLLNILVTGIIRIISLAPFRVLYLFSGLLSFLLFHVVRYRREVVFGNLSNAFPEKSPEEIRKTARKFYQNFADLVLEVIKIRSMKKESLLDRIRFRNEHILSHLYARNQSIIAAIGHCGNWEWTIMALEIISEYRVFGVVKPLNNPFYEDYLKRLRSRFNTRGGLIDFKNTLRDMVRLKNELTITVFAADQTPTKNEINYWTMFLNQETPVFLGVEKIAQKLDTAVVFFDIQRTGRGRYLVDISLLEDNPGKTSQYQITEKYIRCLEKTIRKNPDNWLWSHRRWKHSKEKPA